MRGPAPAQPRGKFSEFMHAVLQLAYRRPAPRVVVALYLSVRWRCRVWPSARIEWPGRLRIGRRARLYGCRVIARGRIVLGAGAELHDYAFLDTQTAEGEIVIGSGTAIGPFTVIYGRGGVYIGEGCSIAGQSMIVSETHVSRDLSRPLRAQGSESEPIHIGDDVWIGAQCTVLHGAVIGEGAIVGANSLVRGALPARVVAAGTPAKIIRGRADRDSAAS